MTVEERAGFARTRWVGQPLVRVEDPKMLMGVARYVGDLAPAGAVEAAFVRSTLPHARIRAIDASAALALPGVLAVYTAADLAGTTPLRDLVAIPEVQSTPRGALAGDRVRFVGEPVAVVIAADRYVAEDAVALVTVDYDPLPPVASVEAAVADGAPRLHDDIEGNCYYRAEGDTGRTDEVLASAPHVVRRTLHLARAVSSAMEARGIVAALDPATEELTCWISSQAPHQQRYFLSLALGLPENRIRVVAPAVGGAFGPKDFIFPEDVCVAWAAIRLRRPVRWIEDRRENLTAAPQAKEQVLELELAADANGCLLAARGRFTGDTGAYSYSAPGGLIDFALTAQGLPGPYRMGCYAFEIAGVLTNKAPIAPYRGVGFTAAQIIREMALDDLAREIGLDPVELRRRNLLDGAPTTSLTGMAYDGGSYRTSLERAVELVDYAGFRERQEAARAEGRLLGIGVSPFVEMTAMGTRSALQSGVNIFSHDNARVTIDLTGKITVAVGTCSHGQGHHTAFAQVAADAFGVDPGDVVVVDGDTGRTPWGMGTFASRSAVFGTGSILAAATRVRDKLLRVASLLLEAPPEALECADGFVGIRGVPEAKIPFAGLAGAAHFDPGVREALGDPTLTAEAFFDVDPTFSNGVVVAVVEVDRETGEVTVERICAVEDCGPMLNPALVEGQVRGGVAQGLGLALMEDHVYDEQARPLTTTLHGYLLPHSTDLPEIEIAHLETPSAHTPAGVKGMAEGSSIATPAAVANAVLDAIAPAGRDIDRLPLTPSTIWAALHGTENHG
ncbi:xanthine dehydrogenase family protein molybdopterin-binding subunit [Blastococcus sp. SYSU D00820]